MFLIQIVNALFHLQSIIETAAHSQKMGNILSNNVLNLLVNVKQPLFLGNCDLLTVVSFFREWTVFLPLQRKSNVSQRPTSRRQQNQICLFVQASFTG